MAEGQDVWTVGKMLSWTCDYLTEKGDEHPRLSAEWLICDVLNISRVQVYMSFDRVFLPAELARMRTAVKRRAAGEPLQYVTGEMPFRHIVLKCERGVLIPRPETEILVEEALSGVDAARARNEFWPLTETFAQLPTPAVPTPAVPAPAVPAPTALATAASADAPAGDKNLETEAPSVPVSSFAAADTDEDSLAPDPIIYVPGPEITHGAAHIPGPGEQPEEVLLAQNDGTDAASQDAADATLQESLGIRVLEIGCGTGCIACSIASERPDAQVITTDLSPIAVSLARRNVQALALSERVRVVECNLVDGVDASLQHTFSVLVSNPPYIPTSEVPTLPHEVSDFEPHLALDGGPDGLDVFRKILALAPTYLVPGGLMCVELHETTLDAAAQLAHEQGGWKEVRIVEDLTHRPRILVAVRED
ncbi:MAG: N5-glutamine methyltransferase family protein [Atopobiaceae bacterium]|jgi:release factor glutamine methyltransferase